MHSLKKLKLQLFEIPMIYGNLSSNNQPTEYLYKLYNIDGSQLPHSRFNKGSSPFPQGIEANRCPRSYNCNKSRHQARTLLHLLQHQSQGAKVQSGSQLCMLW
jgi:hypothetical protein